MRWIALLLFLALGAQAQPVATLARIEADPAAYFGREVVLVGYLWPWFAPTPLVCRGLPLAQGNQAETRCDANFCDGTRVAFLPLGRGPGLMPKRRAPLLLRVRVEPAPGGWRLRVVRVLGVR